jgi:uncharacterized membrane protein
MTEPLQPRPSRFPPGLLSWEYLGFLLLVLLALACNVVAAVQAARTGHSGQLFLSCLAIAYPLWLTVRFLCDTIAWLLEWRELHRDGDPVAHILDQEEH